MKPITNGHGVLKSITRAQYRAGDWECVGEKWTEEEIARFHRWQTVRNWRDEE